MTLTRTDHGIIAAALLLPLVTSGLAALSPGTGLQISQYGQIPVIVLGIALLLLLRRQWHGEIGRGITLAGAGFTLLFFVWTPHDIWRFAKTPAWLGLSPGMWAGLFGGVTLLAAALVAYGCYWLLRAAQRMNQPEVVPEQTFGTRDTLFIAVFLLLTPVLTLHFAPATSRPAVLAAEHVLQLVELGLFLTAFLFLIAARPLLPEQLQRSAILASTGLLFTVFWWFHTVWDALNPASAFGPPLLGLAPQVWTTFLSMALVSGFVLIVYAFYLTWKAGDIPS